MAATWQTDRVVRWSSTFFGLTAEQVRDRFPAVYGHLVETVKPERDENNRATYRDSWWIFGEPRADLRPALEGLPRFIATIETSKHRFFQFLDGSVLPDNRLVCFGLSNAALLAIMSSRVHVGFALAAGGTLEDRPIYTKTTIYDRFPFPLTKDTPPSLIDRLETLGERLDAFRKDRIAAHPHLTMTGLYNALERLRELASGADVPPLSEAERDIKDAGQIQVLRDLHDDIDRAVLDAYGWADLAQALVGKPGATTPSPHKSPAQISAEEEVLVRLVALNQARQVSEAKGRIEWLRPA